MTRFPPFHLRWLRNRIPVAQLIEHELELPTKKREGLRRFLCPLCREFHTATNPKTNLARCFRCKRNFNPIDMVMIVRHCSFTEAVRFLERLSRAYPQDRSLHVDDHAIEEGSYLLNHAPRSWRYDSQQTTQNPKEGEFP